MDDLGTARERVWRAALRGASAEVGDMTLAREAADRTADRFVDRLARSSAPRQPEAWARTVGRNEARGLVRRQRQMTIGLLANADEGVAGPVQSRSAGTPVDRAMLGRLLGARGRLLTRKQREVVWWVSRGASLHQIAKTQRRDRSGLRRLFHRALDRLLHGAGRRGG